MNRIEVPLHLRAFARRAAEWDTERVAAKQREYESQGRYVEADILLDELRSR